jgi:H+/gluconate symporter-like permease
VLVTMSGALLLGLLIALLIRVRYLRWLEVLLCSVFGFLLAKTAAAPVVQTVIEGVGGFLGQLQF